MVKYIDVEKLRAKIERRNLANYCGTAEQYEEELLAFLDTLPEQPVEELEEEIKRYLHEEHDRDTTVRDVARHFAEWQKAQDQKTIELAEEHAMLAGMDKMEQQMMEKAVEGYVCKNDRVAEAPFYYVESVCYDVGDLMLGDKVRVIVIKEDEK